MTSDDGVILHIVRGNSSDGTHAGAGAPVDASTGSPRQVHGRVHAMSVSMSVSSYKDSAYFLRSLVQQLKCSGITAALYILSFIIVISYSNS